MSTVISFGVLFISMVYIMKDSTAIEIHMINNITVPVGSLNQGVNCSYSTQSTEFPLLIDMKMKITTSLKYIKIATFFPWYIGSLPNLTSDGYYLIDRVTLINPTKTDRTATLLFNEIQCEDKTEYICEIQYATSGQTFTMESNRIIFSVFREPAKPDYIVPSVQLSKVENGQNVNFTCSSIIGNPDVGKLIWRKQKNGMELERYYDTFTEIEGLPENCTFRGTSTLEIQINEMDHGSFIECTVETLASNKNMWIQTQKINVNYKVRRILITKDPDMERYTAGSIDQINLTCYAEGNPMPTYHWYKESYNDTSLVTDSMLYLLDPSVNMTGVYVCTVFQNFGGAIYSISKSFDLSVVSLDSSAILNGDSNMIFVIILVSACSVLGVIVVITVVVLRYAHNKRQRRRSINKIVNEESEHETETVKKQIQVTLSSDYGTVLDATDKPLSNSISLLKTEGSQYCEVDLTVDKLSKQGNTTNRNLFNNEMSTDQIKVVKSPASSAIYASVNKRPTSDNTSDTRSPDSGHMTNRDSNHTQDSTQVSQKNKNALDPTKQEVKILSSSNSDNAGIPGVDLKSHEKQVLNLEPKVRAKNQSSSSNGDQSVPTILSPVEKVSSV